jgi:hypothetical protein
MTFLQDVIGLGSPDERFGMFIMHGDVFVNGGNQFRHALEYAARVMLWQRAGNLVQ